MSPARQRGIAAIGTAVGVSAAIAVSGGGSTYAAFSDFDSVEDNQVGAARVALGLPGGNAPELSYTGLLPGVPQTDTLPISYVGSIPGDLALEFRPQGGSAYCELAVDGTWSALDGGSVQLSLGGGWFDYCSLFDPGASVPVGSEVQPGSDLDVQVSVQLAPGSDHRFSELSDVDVLTVTARQTGVGAFTDWAVGTISIGTGLIQPPIPAACGDLGQYSEIIVGTDEDDVLDAGNGKAIVLGLGGDDVLTGANGKDCLVGGDGDDTLHGGNAPDIMIGGTGFDTCTGGHAPDTYECEAPVESRSSAALSLTPDEEPLAVDGEAEVGLPTPEVADPDSDEADPEAPLAEDAGTEDPAAPAVGGGSA